MIVADSSYIAEGVLVDEALLRKDDMVAPDLAIYETMGAIWKHQVLLGRISDGQGYLAALADLVRSNRLVALEPDNRLVSATYDLSARYRAHPRDAIFVALAFMTGLELKTFDRNQKRILERETARRGRTRSGSTERLDRR